MSEKEWRRFVSRCARKVKHATQAEADDHAITEPGLSSYHCDECGQWHVGHGNEQAARETRERVAARYADDGA